MAFEDVFNSDLVDYSGDFENQDKDYYALKNGQVALVNALYGNMWKEYDYGKLIKEKYGRKSPWWEDMSKKYEMISWWNRDGVKVATVYLNPSTFKIWMGSANRGDHNFSRDLKKLEEAGLKIREVYIEGFTRVQKYDELGNYMFPEKASTVRQFIMHYEMTYYTSLQRRLLTNFIKRYYDIRYLTEIEENYSDWISKVEVHSKNDPAREKRYTRDEHSYVYIGNSKWYWLLRRWAEKLL